MSGDDKHRCPLCFDRWTTTSICAECAAECVASGVTPPAPTATLGEVGRWLLDYAKKHGERVDQRIGPHRARR